MKLKFSGLKVTTIIVNKLLQGITVGTCNILMIIDTQQQYPHIIQYNILIILTARNVPALLPSAKKIGQNTKNLKDFWYFGQIFFGGPNSSKVTLAKIAIL